MSSFSSLMRSLLSEGVKRIGKTGVVLLIALALLTIFRLFTPPPAQETKSLPEEEVRRIQSGFRAKPFEDVPLPEGFALVLYPNEEEMKALRLVEDFAADRLSNLYPNMKLTVKREQIIMTADLPPRQSPVEFKDEFLRQYNARVIGLGWLPIEPCMLVHEDRRSAIVSCTFQRITSDKKRGLHYILSLDHEHAWLYFYRREDDVGASTPSPDGN